MSIVEEQNLFLRDVSELIDYVQSEGWMVTGGDLFRSKDEQERLLKAGKSQTIKSKHMERKAIDLFFFKPVDGKYKIIWSKDDLAWIGQWWESHRPGNRWGGFVKGFINVTHFESN